MASKKTEMEIAVFRVGIITGRKVETVDFRGRWNAVDDVGYVIDGDLVGGGETVVVIGRRRRNVVGDVDGIRLDVDREFLLRMSYMEIYNEEINDLLAPEHRKLQIHESLERGIFVAGLREEIVASPEQVLDFMEFGESHRHIGETNMNIYSSRSHTIFRMIIESRDKTEDGDGGSSCDAVRVSVLNLVDLAGSERAAKTGAEGVRLKEGSHINKSLMTLGTVIKKLSEDAESQGGHVPYRDSKLTRILQPALGGNANTAIICNITLAQILTDAALLKRQKKEIEELRAKLQSELERERIALELQEEKKAQEQRERRLQEQAKKIANLSSMVLYSNRDEKHNHYKKVSSAQLKASAGKPTRPERDTGLPLPFEKLVNENEVGVDDLTCITDNIGNNASLDCTLPDAHALLHVNNELVEQAENEDLLLKFETQTANDIEIQCITNTLAETELLSDVKYIGSSTCQLSGNTFHGDRNLSLRESEAILVIKQLQEQIKMLEMEKSSIQQNLDSVVELATEQNISSKEKYEELYQELLDARKEAKVACEQLASEASVRTIGEENVDSLIELSLEIQEIVLEVQSSRNHSESISSVVDELFQCFSPVSQLFLELKSFMCQNSVQLQAIISNHEKIHSCMRKKVLEVESDKSDLHNQSVDLRKQIDEFRVGVQKSEKALMELSQQQDFEKAEFLSKIRNLEKELSSLSSCSLAREKENLRKDLEKTKIKLKETEFKLKNTIQDKTKLEGERAYAEREIKQLHGQKTLLQRDISKRDSLAGRRRDSVADRRRESKAFDTNKGKGHIGSVEQTLQGDYKKLEVLAFELETTVASLEEDLIAANIEKEEALCRNEILASELEAMSNKLNMSTSELEILQEEVSSLNLTDAILELEEEKAIWSAKEKASVEAIAEKTKLSSAEIMLLSKEMSEVRHDLESCRQECEVLRERLALSEENAEWKNKCSMEKALEIDQLRNELKTSQVKSKKCQDIIQSKFEMVSQEHHRACDEMEKLQKELSVLNKEREELSVKIREMNKGSDFSNEFQDLKNQLLVMTKERDRLLSENEEQERHMIKLESLNKNYNDMLLKAKVDVEELNRSFSSMESKMLNDKVNNSKENAKVRMRLRMTQAKLDSFRGRYKEAIEEMGFMNRKFEEASTKLKEQLVSRGIEVLHLTKLLAEAK
ncbi:hypothetical protein HHK36_011741 [Tetracentron sinense]|uniref:Kinesin motor domain-containing protein n=1 Tax=Tetracentron sinense TaxID=13715 RepID=A0A835DK55_TETSI|nr:hypothetical protein HHK36_011741 [Tetracentron sinense]